MSFAENTLIRKVPYALWLKETDVVVNVVSKSSRLALSDWTLLATAARRLSFSSNSLLSDFVENRPGLGTESVGDLVSSIISVGHKLWTWTGSGSNYKLCISL